MPDYKGPGFADNLYKPAVISYGRAIFVITLVLYLAMNDKCWQCIVFLCNGMCNYVLHHSFKLKARYDKCIGRFKAWKWYYSDKKTV